MTEEKFKQLEELRNRIANLKIIKLRLESSINKNQISFRVKLSVFGNESGTDFQEHNIIPAESDESDAEYIINSINQRIADLQEQFDNS